MAFGVASQMAWSPAPKVRSSSYAHASDVSEAAIEPTADAVRALITHTSAAKPQFALS
jgi:hypothetical protein